jgi:hypothetical protein
VWAAARDTCTTFSLGVYLQACRGDKVEERMTVTDAGTDHFVTPLEKDCLVVYSTVEGEYF